MGLCVHLHPGYHSPDGARNLKLGTTFEVFPLISAHRYQTDANTSLFGRGYSIIGI